MSKVGEYALVNASYSYMSSYTVKHEQTNCQCCMQVPLCKVSQLTTCMRRGRLHMMRLAKTGIDNQGWPGKYHGEGLRGAAGSVNARLEASVLQDSMGCHVDSRMLERAAPVNNFAVTGLPRMWRSLNVGQSEQKPDSSASDLPRMRGDLVACLVLCLVSGAAGAR
jgi:hypothetical protein